MSGRCEKDEVWRRSTQARTGTRAALGRGHGSGCDTTGPLMARRWASEHLDAPHRTASTVGTSGGPTRKLVVLAWLGRSFELRILRLAERATAAGEQSRAAAVGEEPIVADTDEALGEDVRKRRVNSASGSVRDRDRRADSPCSGESRPRHRHGAADGSRSRCGGCSGRDIRARARERRTAAWRRPPIRCGMPHGDSGRAEELRASEAAVPRGVGTPHGARPRTCRGRVATAPVGRTRAGRHATCVRPRSVHPPAPHSVRADGG